MFERFASSTRRIIVEAQAEARDLGHHAIATHHLVLGLLVPDPDTNSPVRAFLLSAGLDLDRARAAVTDAEVRRSSAPIIGRIPFSPRSKKVLEMAFREAAADGSDIQPQHLLLGILREGAGSGCRLLDSYGVTLEVVRAWLTSSTTRPFAFPMPGTSVQPIRPIRMTPGARRVTELAQQVAGGPEATIATQHLLLALLDEQDGAAAAVLSALGVTRHTVEAKFGEVGTAGTSDGPPPPRVAKVGNGVEVRIDDPELAKLLDDAGEAGLGDVVRQALLDHLSAKRPQG